MQTREMGPRNETEKPQINALWEPRAARCVAPLSPARPPQGTESPLPPSLNPSPGNPSLPSASMLSKANRVAGLPREGQRSTELGCQPQALALPPPELAPPGPSPEAAYPFPGHLGPITDAAWEGSLPAGPPAAESKRTTGFVNMCGMCGPCSILSQPRPARPHS